MKKKVLVLGGYGTLGRAVSTALAADPLIECVVGGRRATAGQEWATSIGAAFVAVDVNDVASVRSVLPGLFAVVDACGAFEERDQSVAEECLARGVHYVDTADAQEYVQGILDLKNKARRRGSLLVTGAGCMPALASVLADTLIGEFDRIDEIRVQVARGGQAGLGPASVRGLLAGAGHPFRFKHKGRWRDAYGWSKPKRVAFPAPLGRRRIYLNSAPGLELFSQHYGANTVSLRMGLPKGVLDRGLALFGRLRRLGVVRNPRAFSGPLALFSKMFRKALPASGIGVEIRGDQAGQPVVRRIDLIVRDANAVALAASPVIALVKKWVRDGVTEAGALACLGLLEFEDVKQQLLPYDAVLVLA